MANSFNKINLEAEYVRSMVIKNGYFFLSNFIQEDRLGLLIDAFDKLHGLTHNLYSSNHVSSQYDPNSGIRLLTNTNSTQIILDALSTSESKTYPRGKFTRYLPSSYADLLDLDLLYKITDLYFGAEGIFGTRMQFIRSQKTKSAEKIPFIPHYDRIRSLKFYFYLTHVGEPDGALAVEKFGSTIIENERKRFEQFSANTPWNRITGEVTDAKTRKLTGKPGDLIIFDSNHTHLHGMNTSGKTRKVFMIESQTKKDIQHGYNTKLSMELTHKNI
ncbi:phytanoyl-CoA dioxygenase family protein [Synechococcus sp. AH-551-A10]|nr:hypothetical protein [Synechococcus sp. AH-551-A10]MDB4682079.1 phytanoyl-CoA dioxygenase family protein [Synechococcus sp. AH-551-A10]